MQEKDDNAAEHRSLGLFFFLALAVMNDGRIATVGIDQTVHAPLKILNK